ncbi:MAG TPA: hypothetical protein VND93_14840 [Myxococcales bacterium]|nr:hypothetical protein [Myxococcales bacterium]
MAQFSLFLTPRQKIEKRVRKRFGDQAEEAMRELDRCTDEWGSRERTQAAILKLTTGTLENLRRWVERARYDARDVIGPAEEPTAAGARMVREFNGWKQDPAAAAETSFADLLDDHAEPRG